MVEGELRIIGTAQHNALVAYQGAAVGKRGASHKDQAGLATKVDGRRTGHALGRKRISLYLGDGNDRVLFTNLALAKPAGRLRSIAGDMSDGNDTVVFSGNTGTPRAFTLNQNTPVPYGPVNIGGSVFVDGGARETIT